MLLQMQRNTKLMFTATRTHGSIILNFPTRTPRSFSAELLTGQLMPSQYWCMGLWYPKDVSLHLPLNLVDRFLSVPFLSVFWDPPEWQGGQAGSQRSWARSLSPVSLHRVPSTHHPGSQQWETGGWLPLSNATFNQLPGRLQTADAVQVWILLLLYF